MTTILGNRKILVVRPTCGLADSLRALSSFVWIARHTKRQLVVLSHRGFNGIVSTDLFDWNAMNVMTMEDSSILPLVTVAFLECYNVVLPRHIVKVQLKRFNYNVADAAPILQCKNDVVYVETSNALAPQVPLNPRVFATWMRENYKSLRFHASITDGFNEVLPSLPQNDFVVLHIRRSDLARYRMCAENYQVHKYLEYARRFKHKTLVLCTDDKTVRQQLADQCTIIDPPPAFQDGKQAIFDFLVISRATFVVGSMQSSFALEAFYFGDVGRHFYAVGHKIESFYVPYTSSRFLFILLLLVFIVLLIPIALTSGLIRMFSVLSALLSLLCVIASVLLVPIYDWHNKVVIQIDL